MSLDTILRSYLNFTHLWATKTFKDLSDMWLPAYCLGYVLPRTHSIPEVNKQWTNYNILCDNLPHQYPLNMHVSSLARCTLLRHNARNYKILQCMPQSLNDFLFCCATYVLDDRVWVGIIYTQTALNTLYAARCISQILGIVAQIVMRRFMVPNPTTRVATKLVGAGRAWPALMKTDQQGREKTENRPAKKEKKKLTDRHLSSKIG